jgi:multidrug efflux system membrane fusion protein
VRAGALLAEIDPRSFQMRSRRPKARWRATRRGRTPGSISSASRPDRQGRAPKQQFDTQEALVRQLQGTVLTDQAQVDNARLQLSYTKITAHLGPGRAEAGRPRQHGPCQ